MVKYRADISPMKKTSNSVSAPHRARPSQTGAARAAARAIPASKALIPVDKASQVRALSSPLRQDIVDLLQALSQASVPELAEHLGRPADALYYHVRALQKVGLLVEAGTQRRGRQTEAVYSTVDPSRRLIVKYRQGGKATTRPVRELVASMLRSARVEFDVAIGNAGCVVEGPRRELWAGRVKGWLTPSELEQVNQHLLQLGALLSKPRNARRDRLYSLQFILAPSTMGGASPKVPVKTSTRPVSTSNRRASGGRTT